MVLAFVVATVAGMTGARSESANRVSEKALTNAINATVFIEVQRTYHGSQWWNTGTGFFLNEDGFILTNSHVAGDWLEWNIRGESVWVEMTVIETRVVIYPRTPKQKVLPARVVAIDRGRDLALLKVNHRVKYYLGLKKGMRTNLLDDIFVVGFPFGEMLTMDEHGLAARRGGYPEVSVNSGTVTSMRKDDDGRVVAIQTDAAINFGNSGGPMLNSSGDLIGVVYSAITGGAQIGFAIAPTRVWDFINAQLIDARFLPPYVSEARDPVLLKVNAGALIEDFAGGTIELSGADIPNRTFELRQIDGEWRTVLIFPAPKTPQPSLLYYVAEVRLVDSEGNEVASHRYRIRARHSSDNKHENSKSTPRYLNNEMSIHDLAHKRAAERSADEGRELSSKSRTAAALEKEKPALEPKAPVDLASLRDRARTLFRGGEYEAAAVILTQIVEADPDDEIARDYLELARGNLALEEARINESYVDDLLVDDDAERGPRTAAITLVFNSPLKSAVIRLWIDGKAVDPPFKFARSDSKRGNVEHVIEVQPGSHVVEVELISNSEPLGRISFEESFDRGSRWTLRLDLPPDSSQATGFLVQRRN